MRTDSSAAERNVVLFVTDDQSPDAGCYGVEAIKTPHIDALAKDGVLYIVSRNTLFAIAGE